MSARRDAIPTISYTAPPERLAEQVLSATTATGFFYLTDVPIPAASLATAWRASRDFFLADDDEAFLAKQASRNRINHTGYTAVHEEKLDPGNDDVAPLGDAKESFYIARLKPTPQQTLPPLLAAHTDALSDLYESCKGVCDVVLKAVARGLALSDGDYFAREHNGNGNRVRLIHYPPAKVDTQASTNIRAGAHTDYGLMTLLFQRDVGGLQVLRQGRWIDVAPPSSSSPQLSTLVVNVGDALEFWTGGVLQSAQHRVVMPRTEQESVSRFSIAYFCESNADTLLDCEPVLRQTHVRRARSLEEYEEELHRKGIDPSFGHITGGQHLKARLEASYKATGVLPAPN